MSRRRPIGQGVDASRQRFDLFCYVFDTPIEMPPIATEVLDDPDHTGGQYVDAPGQKFRELLTKEPKTLAYRNAEACPRWTTRWQLNRSAQFGPKETSR